MPGPHAAGRAPVSSLLLRFMRVSFVRCEKDTGRWPLRLLLPRSRSVRCEREEYKDGSTPVRLHPESVMAFRDVSRVRVVGREVAKGRPTSDTPTTLTGAVVVLIAGSWEVACNLRWLGAIPLPS